MKKTLILTVLMVVMLISIFAISVSATEIDGIHYTLNSNKTATVSDGNKNGTISVVNIPETVFYNNTTYTVTSIDVNAFWGNKNITSVSFPSTIKVWDKGYTFNGCSNLSSFTFPKDCTISLIPSSAFAGTALTSIDIPETVTELGQSAFHGCSKLTSIVLPKGLTKWGDNVFQNCSNITSLVIPEGITKIPHNGLHGCTGLRELTVPKGCTVYGQYSFNQNGSKITIKYTGTEGDTGYESFKKYLSQAKYEFVNHCEIYYDNNHDIETNYVFTSFVDECYTEDKCSRCENSSKGEIFDAMFKFLGYSTNGKRICTSYVIDNDSIEKFNEAKPEANLQFGFIIAKETDVLIDANGNFYQESINFDLTESNYIGFDFILTGDFTNIESASALLTMNIYTLVASENDTVDVKYIYGETVENRIISKSYDDADLISFNMLISAY